MSIQHHPATDYATINIKAVASVYASVIEDSPFFMDRTLKTGFRSYDAVLMSVLAGLDKVNPRSTQEIEKENYEVVTTYLGDFAKTYFRLFETPVTDLVMIRNRHLLCYLTRIVLESTLYKEIDPAHSSDVLINLAAQVASLFNYVMIYPSAREPITPPIHYLNFLISMSMRENIDYKETITSSIRTKIFDIGTDKKEVLEVANHNPYLKFEILKIVGEHLKVYADKLTTEPVLNDIVKKVFESQESQKFYQLKYRNLLAELYARDQLLERKRQLATQESVNQPTETPATAAKQDPRAADDLLSKVRAIARQSDTNPEKTKEQLRDIASRTEEELLKAAGVADESLSTSSNFTSCSGAVSIPTLVPYATDGTKPDVSTNTPAQTPIKANLVDKFERVEGSRVFHYDRHAVEYLISKSSTDVKEIHRIINQVLFIHDDIFETLKNTDQPEIRQCLLDCNIQPWTIEHDISVDLDDSADLQCIANWVVRQGPGFFNAVLDRSMGESRIHIVFVDECMIITPERPSGQIYFWDVVQGYLLNTRKGVLREVDHEQRIKQIRENLTVFYKSLEVFYHAFKENDLATISKMRIKK